MGKSIPDSIADAEALRQQHMEHSLRNKGGHCGQRAMREGKVRMVENEVREEARWEVQITETLSDPPWPERILRCLLELGTGTVCWCSDQ